MLYGITRSCLLPAPVGTEGPRCQRLLKLIVSEFQHRAYSTPPGFTCQQTGGLAGLTVTERFHTRTQPSTRGPGMLIARRQTKGWAPYGQESQPSKRKGVEPWRESVWQRQEASSMEMGSRPTQHWFGARAVYNVREKTLRGRSNCWIILCFKIDSYKLDARVCFVFFFVVVTRHGSKFFCEFPLWLEDVWNRVETVLTAHSSRAALVSAYFDNLENSYSEWDRKQNFSLPNTKCTQMLAAYFLLEPRVSFVPSKFVKPLSFQLFCYRKIIIHLSTVTGCWKTWIMDSVGPWNSNQATYCQLKPLHNDNSFSVYLKIALNHRCLSDHLTTINFPSQPQIWMRGKIKYWRVW